MPCQALLSLCLSAFLWYGTPVVSQAGVLFDASNASYAFLSGYGQSFPGWGRTTQRVETIDLALRYNKRMVEDIGSGWYRGFYSTIVEISVHVVASSDHIGP